MGNVELKCVIPDRAVFGRGYVTCPFPKESRACFRKPGNRFREAVFFARHLLDVPPEEARTDPHSTSVPISWPLFRSQMPDRRISQMQGVNSKRWPWTWNGDWTCVKTLAPRIDISRPKKSSHTQGRTAYNTQVSAHGRRFGAQHGNLPASALVLQASRMELVRFSSYIKRPPMQDV